MHDRKGASKKTRRVISGGPAGGRSQDASRGVSRPFASPTHDVNCNIRDSSTVTAIDQANAASRNDVQPFRSAVSQRRGPIGKSPQQDGAQGGRATTLARDSLRRAPAGSVLKKGTTGMSNPSQGKAADRGGVSSSRRPQAPPRAADQNQHSTSQNPSIEKQPPVRSDCGGRRGAVGRNMPKAAARRRDLTLFDHIVASAPRSQHDRVRTRQQTGSSGGQQQLGRPSFEKGAFVSPSFGAASGYNKYPSISGPRLMSARSTDTPKPGKQRLGPGKKKLSSLKKKILLDRAERWGQLMAE
ncbi:unnamed protein product, partial [Sphacelaria rigidula]